jgi:hypothetical protein
MNFNLLGKSFKILGCDRLFQGQLAKDSIRAPHGWDHVFIDVGPNPSLAGPLKWMPQASSTSLGLPGGGDTF